MFLPLPLRFPHSYFLTFNAHLKLDPRGPGKARLNVFNEILRSPIEGPAPPPNIGGFLRAYGRDLGCGSTTMERQLQNTRII